jgi:uncharacterized membrane protein YsdA (DUF1294 family)
VAWILGTYVVVSLVTFATYAFDKRRAARGGRRVPERTLHGLELAGGWPGALVAAATFRHKTRKTSYRLVRATIVLLHLVAWGWWIQNR